MKKYKIILVVALMFVLMVGCDHNTFQSEQSQTNIADVIQAQIATEDGDATSGGLDSEITDETGMSSIGENDEATDEIGMPGVGENSSDSDVDYDLTVMGSDMVYATVYQLMVAPDDFIGKTIKIEGVYYASWYEPTQQYYHYVIIQDATACCSQGLEFVWEDGSHLYPEEYPEDDTEVVVTGVFETYQEEGDDNVYCRLKDATLEQKE